jgi:hypothetical protein
MGKKRRLFCRYSRLSWTVLNAGVLCVPDASAFLGEANLIGYILKARVVRAWHPRTVSARL